MSLRGPTVAACREHLLVATAAAAGEAVPPSRAQQMRAACASIEALARALAPLPVLHWPEGSWAVTPETPAGWAAPHPWVCGYCGGVVRATVVHHCA